MEKQTCSCPRCRNLRDEYPDEPELDDRPARNDLTSRECAKILAGTITALADQAAIDNVKLAIEWLARSESMWDALRKMKAYSAEHPELDVMVQFGV